MSIKVRPMHQEEKNAIMAILRGLPEFPADEVAVAEELIDCFLKTGPASGYHILVAEAGGAVAGYVCFGPTPLTRGTWDIYWIGVDHSRQGLGIGHALIAGAEDCIKKAAGRLVLIETSSQPAYAKTVRFYRACGYEQVSRIPDFYAPGDDKLVFQKRLE